MALVVSLETDKESYVRMAAARALGQIGVAAEDVIIALTRAANDPEPDIRIRAAKSLSQITDDPRIVVPALVACLTNPSTRHQATAALTEMGSEALEVLAELARAPDTSPLVRGAAERVIAKIQQQLPATTPQESTQR